MSKQVSYYHYFLTVSIYLYVLSVGYTKNIKDIPIGSFASFCDVIATSTWQGKNNLSLNQKLQVPENENEVP